MRVVEGFGGFRPIEGVICKNVKAPFSFLYKAVVGNFGNAHFLVSFLVDCVALLRNERESLRGILVPCQSALRTSSFCFFLSDLAHRVSSRPQSSC